MKLTVETHSYPLRAPFVISGHTFLETGTVVATLHDGEMTGRGEAVGVYYLGETADSMAAQLEGVAEAIDASLTRAAIQTLLAPGGARNALDCAFWDLSAKRAGRRIWDLLSVEPQELTTVYTISIAEPELMGEMAAAAARFPHLKIKLDDRRPMACLEAVRAARPDAKLIVDANQAWDFDALREYLPACERLGVAMIEQPLPRGGDEALEGFRSAVPLGADESCLDLREFDQAARRYDVLNIKLDKCGGLTEGLALVEAGKRAGMQLMVGNMTGTSLSMAPACVIGQHCRFIDIDGPLLLADDVEHALRFADGGGVSLPTAELWG